MARPSRQMRSPLLARGLFLAGVALLVPAAGWAATYCEWTFYSDATYTTIVGERTKNCQGQVYSWGTTTSFVYHSCEACGGGGAFPATDAAAAIGPDAVPVPGPAACVGLPAR